jgi:hypothetical protein
MNVILGGVDKFDDQPMYWNNEDGWGSIDSATRFTDKERATSEYIPKYDEKDSSWVWVPD